MKKENDEQKEFIPFGEEWLEQVNLATKAELILMYREVCIELQQAKQQNINNMFRGI